MCTVLRLIILGICFYAAWAIFIFFAQSHLIYHPEIDREIVNTPDQLSMPYESVVLTTSDQEKLHGWFVPAAKETTATILFLHGNAGNISHRMGYLSIFHQLGYNTFIVDYRGYGNSSGTPTEEGTYQDALTAWNYLIENKTIPGSRIVLFGESLGGAIAAWLASKNDPGALVLASTFTSIPDIAADLYPLLPVRLMARFHYNTSKYLQSVTCPVIVAHSPEDEIVPFKHAQALFDKAPNPKQFIVLQGKHNDSFFVEQDAWVHPLNQFIRASLSAYK
ncbi:MAG: alpha/beta hydrolase [Nitrosomonas sp.]|nr:MAG: alpha/beta hydrolase [Nitrosomonas sp.]